MCVLFSKHCAGKGRRYV